MADTKEKEENNLNAPSDKPDPVKVSIRKKVTGLIILAIIISNTVALSISYLLFQKAITDYYAEFAQNLSFTITALIDPYEIKKYAEGTEPDDYYYGICSALQAIQDQTETEYISIILMGEDVSTFIIDTDENDGIELGTQVDTAELMEEFVKDSLNDIDPSHFSSSTAAYSYLLDEADGDQELTVAAKVSMAKVNELRKYYLHWVAIADIICIVVVAFLGMLFTNSIIIKPIRKLTAAASGFVKKRSAAEKRSEEDPDEDNVEAYLQVHDLELNTHDELENLACSIRNMEEDIIDYIGDLKRVMKEKRQITVELDLAAQIQAAVLPQTFPAFPERKEFDLFASMDPAKEVGGDFYDYFLIDEEHLGLVIADVSGKGIPAALFMMISMTLIKSECCNTLSPAQVLANVNSVICAKNSGEMFVTVWLGVLEISTGRLISANAGHEYPALRKRNGSFELIRSKHGFVVGGMEGIRYRELEWILDPGDILFLYTDGAPEATRADMEQFGTDRMLAALNSVSGDDLRKMEKSVQDAIGDFVKDAPQFDDTTMLIFRYDGPGGRQKD